MTLTTSSPPERKAGCVVACRPMSRLTERLAAENVDASVNLGFLVLGPFSGKCGSFYALGVPSLRSLYEGSYSFGHISIATPTGPK